MQTFSLAPIDFVADCTRVTFAKTLARSFPCCQPAGCYCGAASALADRVLRCLEDDVGATVLDWQRDFAPGRSILEEIEEARLRCTTGVFLFTKDDSLSNPASGDAASPRDNVVFGAGYFVSGKGKKRVLIIREGGTKMPADLGGDIYASLTTATISPPPSRHYEDFWRGSDSRATPLRKSPLTPAGRRMTDRDRLLVERHLLAHTPPRVHRLKVGATPRELRGAWGAAHRVLRGRLAPAMSANDELTTSPEIVGGSVRAN